EGFGGTTATGAADAGGLRERAATAHEFDTAELSRGKHSTSAPSLLLAALPLAVVILVNMAMSLVILPRLDLAFLAKARFGGTSLAGVGGVWAVITALASAIVVVLAINFRRLPAVRATIDAG